ncbi:MAG: cytochrome c oxidase accessory protein CcoG [Leptothrix ochracea]|uniref:cytochrome c oxidase accessory protein CcoG n=1 Tax=Leptothrix ochracea TaxID=735331 RepID=UPI0034E21E73
MTTKERPTATLYAPHKKIYAKEVSGYFSKIRWLMVWITQLVFYGVPWLMWNNRPAVIFNLESRRFYIFDLVLYPQDFIFLTAVLMISAYALFLFTAVAGRLWCGYTCPQTVYTEMFMWIENRFEGDRNARMKRDASPWTQDKLLRKTGKQTAWILLSLWTGFTFVSYFTPMRSLINEAMNLDFGAWEWFWIFFYGAATYGFAGSMREQICKYLCPYARFQGAMFDHDTLIITYDNKRGDPRGSRGKKVDPKAAGLGDCIDCNLCVQVCPTGIDIRDGQQYECIGCAACIDVCNGVMDKMGYPQGLVRYATQHGMEQKLTDKQSLMRIFRPRVIIYTAILGAIVFALGYAIWTRDPFKVDIVRDRTTLARVNGEGGVENVYRLQIMNATEEKQVYRVTASGIHGYKIVPDELIKVAATEAEWVTLTVELPFEIAKNEGPGIKAVHFDVHRVNNSGVGEEVVVHEKSTFMIPR